MSLKAERRRAESSQRAVDYTLLLIAETSLRVSRREGVPETRCPLPSWEFIPLFTRLYLHAIAAAIKPFPRSKIREYEPSPIPFILSFFFFFNTVPRESKSWKVSSPSSNCLSFNCDPWMISAITLIMFIGLIKFQRKTTWNASETNESRNGIIYPIRQFSFPPLFHPSALRLSARD